MNVPGLLSYNGVHNFPYHVAKGWPTSCPTSLLSATRLQRRDIERRSMTRTQLCCWLIAHRSIAKLIHAPRNWLQNTVQCSGRIGVKPSQRQECITLVFPSQLSIPFSYLSPSICLFILQVTPLIHSHFDSHSPSFSPLPFHPSHQLPLLPSQFLLSHQ